MKFKYSLPLLLAIASMGAQAEVTLPSVLSDGMVVQRQQPVKIWGTADPGETVAVAAKGQKYKFAQMVQADANGQWSVELPPMRVSKKPYVITVNDLAINDVWAGDVYLCSGQSNMELPVARVTDMFADEVAQYSNPYIRQFQVAKEVSFDGPQADVPAAAWTPVTPENAMVYSALAYFMAKDLYQRNGGVPVGIVNASWGGTPVEAWISEQMLAPVDSRAISELQIYRDDNYRKAIKDLEGANYYHWNSTMDARDPGLAPGQQAYLPDYDDSGWTEVDLLSTQWGTDGLNPKNGSHWLRKTVTVDAAHAGQPATLRLGCIVDADSAWVNGHFVGNITYMYPPRIYPVPAGVLHEGENTVTVRVISQNGTPHFVPEKPYKLVFAPGLDDISLEGKWRYMQGTSMPHGPGMEFWCYKPTVLYNAMIAPLAGLKFDGVVWYQGESNVERRNEYPLLLGTMMKNWRDTFGDEDMPFYIVELADFLHPSDRGGRQAWAETRAQQAKTAEADAHATLIKNSDLGEWNDIHPLDKKTLGTRVADAILKQK